METKVTIARANLNTQLTISKLTTTSATANSVSSGVGSTNAANNHHMDSPNVKNQRQAEFAKSGKVTSYLMDFNSF